MTSPAYRRIRQYQREILGTVFLTLAALGLLVAAIFGQEQATRSSRAVETSREVAIRPNWALMRIGQPGDRP